jgi:hypothetical protein
VRFTDFIRELFDKRGDPDVLRGRLESLGRGKQDWLKMHEVDIEGRSLLSDFEAPEGAAERLAQTVAAPDFWFHALDQEERSERPRLTKLSLSFDVVGHERTERKSRPAKKKAASPPNKRRKRKSKSKKKR